MPPNPADLRRHYASLPDEVLLEMDRADLTPLAQQCYDEELASRNIALDGGIGAAGDADDVADDEIADNHAAGHHTGDDSEGEPAWLEEAACACSFDNAADMDEAREALVKAGIPCHGVTRDRDTPSGQVERHDYYLMVPGALNLRAASVLDKEVFNPQVEAEWRAHFAELSEEDFAAMRLEDLTAGMQDRIKRLTAAFNDQRAARGVR